MKKEYVKPIAEAIDLRAEEAIANEDMELYGIPSMSGGVGDEIED